MKNLFSFKFTKVAGILVSAVFAAGLSMNVSAATEVGNAASPEVPFVGGTFDTGLDTYSETSEGVWTNDNDSSETLNQSAIDNLVVNNPSFTYDAGTQFAAEVLESGLFADTTANANDIDDLQDQIDALPTPNDGADGATQVLLVLLVPQVLQVQMVLMVLMVLLVLLVLQVLQAQWCYWCHRCCRCRWF